MRNIKKTDTVVTGTCLIHNDGKEDALDRAHCTAISWFSLLVAREQRNWLKTVNKWLHWRKLMNCEPSETLRYNVLIEMLLETKDADKLWTDQRKMMSEEIKTKGKRAKNSPLRETGCLHARNEWTQINAWRRWKQYGTIKSDAQWITEYSCCCKKMLLPDIIKQN